MKGSATNVRRGSRVPDEINAVLSLADASKTCLEVKHRIVVDFNPGPALNNK